MHVCNACSPARPHMPGLVYVGCKHWNMANVMISPSAAWVLCSITQCRPAFNRKTVNVTQETSSPHRHIQVSQTA